MRVEFWGTRGSIPSSSPLTQIYGGNTPSVRVDADGEILILDAGTGIRELGISLPKNLDHIHLLLTHLHMDHIQGMGFFAPFYSPNMEVHVWGPASFSHSLENRLSRYLSPPLFPVGFRDLPCKLVFHEISGGGFSINGIEIKADYICHPGPTIGYRISFQGKTVTYIPDHEPMLASIDFPNNKNWISGYDLAFKADLLIHDAQFIASEYHKYVGWGHCSFEHALAFAQMAEVKQLRFFHHNPGRTDAEMEAIQEKLMRENDFSFGYAPAKEREVILV